MAILKRTLEMKIRFTKAELDALNKEVESISINGETAFEQGNMFAVDAKIEIVYHDFKKNNPNK